MTEHTYRKKALPYLKKDFAGRCAYCLQSGELRNPSEMHIDHFDCEMRGRERHFYSNLMLACSACNLSKNAKSVVNKFDSRQRLLNCTKETEFPEHIVEAKDGEWRSRTPAGYYHIEALDLNERSHKKRRIYRRQLAQILIETQKKAIQYIADNVIETHNKVMQTVSDLAEQLADSVTFVTCKGTQSFDQFLEQNGVQLPERIAKRLKKTGR